MFWIISVALIGILYVGYKWHSNRNLPPGPIGIPIFGYLPWINPAEPYKTLTELTLKYGSIYSVQMGKQFTVVMSDPTLLRKALAKKELADRTNSEILKEILQEHGLIFSNGTRWKEHRKFVCNWLKIIGMSKLGDKKNDLQLNIINVVSSALLKLQNSNKYPIDTNKLFQTSIGEFISKIVLGKVWPEDDKNWIFLQNVAEDASQKFASAVSPLSVLPFLKIIPKYRKTVFEIIEGLKNTHFIYNTLVEKRGEEIDNCNDLMAMYMKEMITKKGDKDTGHLFNKKQLYFLLADIFGAGVDTTTNSLRWFLLYMAINKEIQNELRTLLESVRTDDEIIDLEQVESVSLLKACVFETMRIRPVAPFGIPRAVNEDITISGYCIPKGTMVVPLLWAMHYDEKYWTDPHSFQPKRFLDNDGNIINHKAFMPFQAGKRACVGGMLAYWLLYLLGGNIICNFNVSMEDNLSEKEVEIIMTGEFGITFGPAKHKLIFEPRI